VAPFLLFIAIGEIWANYLDVYTAGLAGLALNLRLRRWTAALVCGALGGLIAGLALLVSTFKDQYTNFLLITYIWVPSWAAVVLVDLFVFRRRQGTLVGFRASAVVSWLAGLLVAVPFIDSTLWQSPLAVGLLHGTDISGYVGALVGASVYLLLGRR
jgi:NCS1 family nucleobase:cation symporter-1